MTDLRSAALPPGALAAARAAGPGAQDPIEAGLLAAAPYFAAQERERIRGLVVQWRAAAEMLKSSNAAWSSHFYDCANELERLLGEPAATEGGWLAQEFREAEREYKALPDWARPVVVRPAEEP